MLLPGAPNGVSIDSRRDSVTIFGKLNKCRAANAAK